MQIEILLLLEAYVMLIAFYTSCSAYGVFFFLLFLNTREYLNSYFSLSAHEMKSCHLEFYALDSLDGSF